MAKRLRAFNLVRHQPHYRHEAFTNGLKAAGYETFQGQPWWPVGPGEVLVVWNRYGDIEPIANRFEAQGGIVLVAENGYIGTDENGIQYYALAIGGHNGSGIWPQGEGRFEKLGIELKPWRTEGRHIAIRGQRGIGPKAMASPAGWHHETAKRLRNLSNRPLVVKEHPGSKAVTDTSHESYLAGAHACVVWSSSVGVKALAMGIPVFCEAPHWICEGAALKGIKEIENPKMDDAARLKAFERMSWAQWSIAELATGGPFVWLAECAQKRAA